MEIAGEETDENISERCAQLRSELHDMLCESDDSDEEMDQSECDTVGSPLALSASLDWGQLSLY